MRASNNRTNPRYSGDSIQRSWTSLLAERMQWTAARKSIALKTDSGPKTEVSHAEGAVVGRSRIERGPDLGILPTTEKQPAMEYRNEARVVGYLGFCTRIFLNRCTNCAQMGRDVEPLPFPFSLLPLPLLPQPPKLQTGSKSSKTTLPKKYLPKVIGKGPITKNAINARTTRPHRA